MKSGFFILSASCSYSLKLQHAAFCMLLHWEVTEVMWCYEKLSARILLIYLTFAIFGGGHSWQSVMLVGCCTSTFLKSWSNWTGLLILCQTDGWIWLKTWNKHGVMRHLMSHYSQNVLFFTTSLPEKGWKYVCIFFRNNLLHTFTNSHLGVLQHEHRPLLLPLANRAQSSESYKTSNWDTKSQFSCLR